MTPNGSEASSASAFQSLSFGTRSLGLTVAYKMFILVPLEGGIKAKGQKLMAKRVFLV